MDLWDLAYIQLASWTLHPGYLREGASAPSFEDLAHLTNQLMAAREKIKWAQSQQQQ